MVFSWSMDFRLDLRSPHIECVSPIDSANPFVSNGVFRTDWPNAYGKVLFYIKRTQCSHFFFFAFCVFRWTHYYIELLAFYVLNHITLSIPLYMKQEKKRGKACKRKRESKFNTKKRTTRDKIKTSHIWLFSESVLSKVCRGWQQQQHTQCKQQRNKKKTRTQCHI